MKLMYTIEEAAEALGVSRTTVYELVRSGQLEAVKIGRARRVPSDALTTYVAHLRGDRTPDAAA